MATISNADLVKARQKWEEVQSANFVKADLSTAFQAIENWFTTNEASASAAIDTATSPTTLTNPQKKKIFKFWASWKADQ